MMTNYMQRFVITESTVLFTLSQSFIVSNKSPSLKIKIIQKPIRIFYYENIHVHEVCFLKMANTSYVRNASHTVKLMKQQQNGSAHNK